MKLSDLIDVLSDAVDEYGDLHIWKLEMDAPLPDIIELSLVNKITRRKEGGIGSPNSKKNVNLEITVEYEGGTEFVDRSFSEVEE